MKFFERDVKYNWVDDNNVLLGFDAFQCCCESFGSCYHTDLKRPQGSQITLEDSQLDEYEFDPDFYEYGNYEEDCEEGGSFTVRMRKISNPNSTLYLTIYNSHNGYYSHGFTFDKGGITIHHGGL